MDINKQRVDVSNYVNDVNKDMTIGSVNRKRVEQPKDNAVLDQQDFLKILAATISNPPFPGGDGGGGAGGEMDFMSQMMQMNLLDQVTDLTTTIQNTMVMTHQQQALSLVGKKVTIANPETKEGVDDIVGIVEKIRFKPDGVATLQVNGVEYNLQSVISVEEAGSTGTVETPDTKPEGNKVPGTTNPDDGDKSGTDD